MYTAKSHCLCHQVDQVSGKPIYLHPTFPHSFRTVVSSVLKLVSSLTPQPQECDIKSLYPPPLLPVAIFSRCVVRFPGASSRCSFTLLKISWFVKLKFGSEFSWHYKSSASSCVRNKQDIVDVLAPKWVDRLWNDYECSNCDVTSVTAIDHSRVNSKFGHICERYSPLKYAWPRFDLSRSL